MSRIRNAVAVVALIASLVLLPVAAQAAPRDHRADNDGRAEQSLLVSLWDWVSSLWGGGSGQLDPVGLLPTPRWIVPVVDQKGDAVQGAEGRGLRHVG